MIVRFDQISGNIINIVNNEHFVQSDTNTHDIDVIFDTGFDNTNYNAYIQFLRQGETKPSPKIVMTPKVITYNDEIYRGYSFKVQTDWYTAIAGELKATIEVKEYNDDGLQINKAYGIINIPIEDAVDNNPQVVSTITDEEYLALINLVNSKLNIADEKVYKFAEVFTSKYDFAKSCINHKTSHTSHKLYIGIVNDLIYFGIVNNLGTKVTLINGNGEFELTNGNDSLFVELAKLNSSLIQTTDIVTRNAKFEGIVNASNATITVAEPSQYNHPATRAYVDNFQETLSEKIEGIEAAQNLLDIVGSKAELLAYSTEYLQRNDKIKVLQDETMNNAGTYYKWNGSSWEYIGKDGLYYTQAEVEAIKNNLQAQIDSLKALVTTLTASNVSYKEG